MALQASPTLEELLYGAANGIERRGPGNVRRGPISYTLPLCGCQARTQCGSLEYDSADSVIEEVSPLSTLGFLPLSSCEAHLSSADWIHQT